MPVHGVLVQTQQHVQAVAVIVDLQVTDAHGQEDVPAAHDGLIGVVRIQPKPAAGESSCEDVAGGGDALTGRSTDSKGEVKVP